MSYQRMDHAGWVESNNTRLNRIYAKQKNWKPLPEQLSEFQAKVVDIIGMVGGGIYNATVSHGSIDYEWGFGGMSVVWKHPQFATWDFNQLTMLVFLCHEARIRCEIDPAGPHMLRLSFWQRNATGDISTRHPNLDEAVAMFRKYLPADHRIIYREPPAAEGEAREQA
jgi:hypothetical protein